MRRLLSGYIKSKGVFFVCLISQSIFSLNVLIGFSGKSLVKAKKKVMNLPTLLPNATALVTSSGIKRGHFDHSFHLNLILQGTTN
jgi:heme/copper-type cytochrome/quinol oxidase subunit 3